MTNTVVRDGISPAEYMVMQVLHGDHSMTPIEITSQKNTSPSEEMERLRERFRTKNSIAALNAVFPGARPINVPVNFSDIGLDDIQRAEDTQKEALKGTGMSAEDAQAVIAATNKKAAKEEAEVKSAEEAKLKAAEEAELEAEKEEQAAKDAAAVQKQPEAEKPKGQGKKTKAKKTEQKPAKPETKKETEFEDNVKIEYND